jgi:CP family cyanate transporter-like MFS transporter
VGGARAARGGAAAPDGFGSTASGTLGYFGASTFIPDYLHATDRAELIAAALASLSLGQLPGSLLVGLLPWQQIARRRTPLVLGGGALVALAALLVAPGPVFVVAAGLLGAISGAILVIALALPPLTTAPADTPRVAAGVLAICYSVVWLVLLTAGAAWDATHVAGTAFLPAALSGTLVVLLAPPLLRASTEPTPIGVRAVVTAFTSTRTGVLDDTAA